MLEALESEWNQAHMKGDAATLEALWSDDLVVAVPGMPVMSKSDVLSFVGSGRMHFERYETSDIRVRVYGTAALDQRSDQALGWNLRCGPGSGKHGGRRNNAGARLHRYSSLRYCSLGQVQYLRIMVRLTRWMTWKGE
jgi:Domain of unknown function (DUF4440)